MYVDGEGAVWFGCGRSLCRFENGEAREAGTEAGLPQERWEAILGDLEGNLWVRSEHSLYLRPAGSTAVSGSRRIAGSEQRVSRRWRSIRPGRLLVPTYRGLARQTPTGWEIIDAQQGLGTNDICYVMQDREGSIWLALLGSGLAKWLGYDEWQSWSGSRRVEPRIDLVHRAGRARPIVGGHAVRLELRRGFEGPARSGGSSRWRASK